MPLWTPSTVGLVFENHTIADLATSIVNHATGTNDATVNGTWTGAAGYQDITGSGTGLKGLDFGHMIPDGDAHLATVVDFNTACAILGAAGTSAALPGRVRMVLDANPALGVLCTINGQPITLVASGASGFQANLGATAQETAENVNALINTNSAAFDCTAYNGDPGRNMLLELTTLTTGTAANSVTVASSQAMCRFISREGGTSTSVGTVGVFGSGANGESVTAGIYHSSTFIQGRNSMVGTGGLAEITVPSVGFYYVSVVLEKFNFAQLRLWEAGELLSISDRRVSDNAQSAGRRRALSGNVTSGLAAGGSGNAKQSAAGMWSRGLPLDEDKATYLAWQAALAPEGTTVN